MAIDRIDPIFLSQNNVAHQPELMLSAVLHLMSHYTARSAENGACLKLASVIERHLKALAGLPDLGPVLQATCQQLSEQWAAVVERAMPQPHKSSFLSRIMGAAKAAAPAQRPPTSSRQTG
ncbi:hypothetical protein ACFDR9_001155 [Janthinobacterium sp. CG_23.3]|uniref:hypothetical protein n=1 Tax=unclassified Janthinobacterium TaxID=2610881 RepID=UPI00034A4D2F|nr:MULTISPECIES: hypothetical protein [unclassified Janthinobacterium]MEC5161421.1 hypothetical protein [Janthinobacterium sp. CG_S6]